MPRAISSVSIYKTLTQNKSIQEKTLQITLCANANNLTFFQTKTSPKTSERKYARLSA